MTKGAKYWLDWAIAHYQSGLNLRGAELACLECTAAARGALIAVHTEAARTSSRKLALQTLWEDLKQDGLTTWSGPDLSRTVRLLSRARLVLAAEYVDGSYPVWGLFDDRDVGELRGSAWLLLQFARHALRYDGPLNPDRPRSREIDQMDPLDVIYESSNPPHAIALEKLRLQRSQALIDTLRQAISEQAPKTMLLSVLLFGSWARGDFDGGSDVDLIAIIPDQCGDSPGDHGLQLEGVVGDRRLDIVTLTSSGWHEMSADAKEDPIGFARAARREGVLLWRREDAP